MNSALTAQHSAAHTHSLTQYIYIFAYDTIFGFLIYFFASVSVFGCSHRIAFTHSMNLLNLFLCLFLGSHVPLLPLPLSVSYSHSPSNIFCYRSCNSRVGGFIMILLWTGHGTQMILSETWNPSNCIKSAIGGVCVSVCVCARAPVCACVCESADEMRHL